MEFKNLNIQDCTDDTIKELINRRRHQLLIHSVIYYELNDNVISDNQWSEWANELVWRNHSESFTAGRNAGRVFQGVKND